MSKKVLAFVVTIAAILFVSVFGNPESAGQACTAIGLAGSAYVGSQGAVDTWGKGNR
jgi:hypothetical protein